MGEMGEMERNGGGGGGGWGEWGNSGHITRDVGCGGLWQDVGEENGTKMGQKREKNRTKYPFP